MAHTAQQAPVTLYWHDYETSGTDPKWDRPVQFAGVRTDQALNEIGAPLVIYCRPPHDRLPQPEACLLTGISPQMADEQGLMEPVFMARIHEQLMQPGTCALGYNTLRFDDEVTRYALYRNFYDPYAREWQHGNSRWDLIDLVRMTYALRPEGMVWPLNEGGRPSFRLEDIASANQLAHDSAHDALSDVRATIALARLMRAQQPRLYDWLFRLRDKRAVAKLLDLAKHTPVLHTSRMYPAEYGCTTLIMPLLAEANNANSILAYDLRHDPTPFLELDTDALAECLFTPNSDLAAGQLRLPVKTVRLNKCPAIAPQKILDDKVAYRIKLDIGACRHHWQLLQSRQDFWQRVRCVYALREPITANDADQALYQGFIDDHDRSLLQRVRTAPPEQLTELVFPFRDARYPELLFRYRARNWPATLSDEERQRWQAICCTHLTEKVSAGCLTLTEYREKIKLLRNQSPPHAPDAVPMLDNLAAWGEKLALENGLS
ncbi:MAG TPA: exodeoxyribonuclease I [Nitrosomonas halophila]|nr:exodeoxyribonuclease I [Nitrosomonas halophila]